jgi:protein TonB
MTILGNNASKINEVIFENRNKNYGAYQIRESYNNSIKKSLLFLCSFLFLLFGSVIIHNKIYQLPAIELPNILNDPILEPQEYWTEVDNTPIQEPIQNTAAAVAPSGGITTVITDGAIETLSVSNTNLISGTGTPDATGTALTGVEVSTITISNPVINTAPTVSTDVLVFAEEMPEFEGGVAGLMKYISANITYPEIAKEVGQEGTVYVSFIVTETGNVDHVKVMKGIGFGCDEEVLKVISKMPRWKKPGKNAGHFVKVRYNIPVAFKLK